MNDGFDQDADQLDRFTRILYQITGDLTSGHVLAVGGLEPVCVTVPEHVHLEPQFWMVRISEPLHGSDYRFYWPGHNALHLEGRRTHNHNPSLRMSGPKVSIPGCRG